MGHSGVLAIWLSPGAGFRGYSGATGKGLDDSLHAWVHLSGERAHEPIHVFQENGMHCWAGGPRAALVAKPGTGRVCWRYARKDGGPSVPAKILSPFISIFAAQVPHASGPLSRQAESSPAMDERDHPAVVAIGG